MNGAGDVDGDRLVFLDEWPVVLRVRPELSQLEADRLRASTAGALRSFLRSLSANLSLGGAAEIAVDEA